MDLTIRLAVPQDIEQILALQRQSIQALCSQDYDSQQVEAIATSQHWARWNHRRSEHIFLAEKGKTVVGFLAVGRTSCNQIAGLYVHPDHIRQGIATQLLLHFERRAIRLGQPKLWVMSSRTAAALYQKQGYVITGQIQWCARQVAIPCVTLEKLTDIPDHYRLLHRLPTVLWWFGFALSILCIFLAFADGQDQPPQDKPHRKAPPSTLVHLNVKALVNPGYPNNTSVQWDA